MRIRLRRQLTLINTQNMQLDYYAFNYVMPLDVLVVDVAVVVVVVVVSVVAVSVFRILSAALF